MTITPADVARQQERETIQQAAADVATLEEAVVSRKRAMMQATAGAPAAQAELLAMERRAVSRAIENACYGITLMDGNHVPGHDPARMALSLQVNAMEAYSNALGFRIAALTAEEER